jgi:hypothetical protein
LTAPDNRLSGTRIDDPDNVVPYPDQALFLALRGAGQEAVMQGLWIYRHPIDLDGVRRFHRNLFGTLLARRIEPSPLPFGRHRWVSQPITDTNLEISEQPRSPADLYTWADEQVELPLDPQNGPAWRMGVQAFTDGSTAVSLVISHCVADGAGSFLACAQAATGASRDLGYPAAGSRTRWRAIRGDLRQLRRDLPEIGRTLRRAATVARRRRGDLARPPAPASPQSGQGRTVRMPSASVFIDAEQWHACAQSLGGNSFSLVAGFAGRLAQRLKRTRSADGAVTLMLPVSERADLEDTGGNVVSIANVSFDPDPVTTDLTGPRTAIREGLKQAREVPDEMVELLPLIPFLPRRGIARVADAAFGFSTDLPVSCSNFGTMPPEVTQVDGTPAEYLSFRGVDRHVTADNLARRRGAMTVTSGQIASKMSISVISYQPGLENSQAELHKAIADTLQDFGLAGEIF